MQPLRPPDASMSMLIRMNCYSDKRLDDDKTKLRIKLGTTMLPERKIKRFDDKANHNSQYVILREYGNMTKNIVCLCIDPL